MLARSPRDSPPPKKRTRLIVACDTCRSRKQKCDGARPRCSYCQSRGEQFCFYQPVTESQGVKLEQCVAGIKQQLETLTATVNEIYIISKATERQSHPHQYDIQSTNHGTSPSNTAMAENDKSKIQFPFLDLKTPNTMINFQVRSDLSQKLVELERKDVHGQVIRQAGFVIIQHEKVMSALSAFSDEIHQWYPILPADYTAEFQRQISGSLIPSSKTCLALLICSIGSLFTVDKESSPTFMSMAMASLASVMFDNSIESIQSLIMLSIYHNCLYRPCQAHEFAIAASYKVKSLLRVYTGHLESEQVELVRRAYWTILLIENELDVQFELPESGLWSLDEEVPLPTMRDPWRFSSTAGQFPSPYQTTTSPDVAPPATPRSDRVNCYFLAAIAMRRMLHRCTTAIRPSGTVDRGVDYGFAPIIARELEAQLDEWYTYLPQAVRFDKSDDLLTTPGSLDYSSDEPLLKFLHVQYDCCRASIYWPAVWEVIRTGYARPELYPYCQKFFRSYMYIVPNISSLLARCRVNTWTLYATVFILTLAVAESIKSSGPGASIPHNIIDVVVTAPQIFEPVRHESSSLGFLQELLEDRVTFLVKNVFPDREITL